MTDAAESTALEMAAPGQVVRGQEWSADQVDLIKRTIARGATDDELKLFLYTSKRMGLDPLANQIHAVKRWDANTRRETMAIQIGIDGFRLVADRTGKYAPGRPTEFSYDKNGRVVAATAYVRKLVNGEWHEAGETAHYDEYVARRKDGKPNRMWATKPHIMLAKCAEARALRRCFPAELSGVYTSEEMDQAGEPINREARQKSAQKKADKESKSQWPAWVPRLWHRAEKAGVMLDEWKGMLDYHEIEKGKPISDDSRAAFTAEVEERIKMLNSPSPAEPEKMFATDEMIETLCQAAQGCGIAQDEKELIAFLKFRLDLPEGFADVKTLTADEVQAALMAVDKYGGCSDAR